MYDCWEQQHKATCVTCPVTLALSYLKYTLEWCLPFPAALTFMAPSPYSMLTRSSSLPITSKCAALPSSLKWTTVHIPQPSFIISHTFPQIIFLHNSKSYCVIILAKRFLVSTVILERDQSQHLFIVFYQHSPPGSYSLCSTLLSYQALSPNKSSQSRKRCHTFLKKTLIAVILNCYAARNIMGPVKLKVQPGTRANSLPSKTWRYSLSLSLSL